MKKNRKDMIEDLQTLKAFFEEQSGAYPMSLEYAIKELSEQPEIIHCKECKYGEQDDIGRWFCRGFGCQVGDECGNGFCSDAERRKDGSD